MPRNTTVVLVAMLAIACKQSPIETQPPDAGPPALPPGEEWIEGPTNNEEAEAMAEPLAPGPGSMLITEEGVGNSPAALRQYEMGVRFRRGEAVDMNGDGRPDHFGKWVNGKFTYTIDENQDGKPDEEFDGTTRRVDSDLDGRWNTVETVTRRANNGIKRVQESDTNEDGVLDERHTEEQLSPTRRAFKTEKRNAAGQWEVTEEWTGPEYDSQRTEVPGEAERDDCKAGMRERFPAELGPPHYSIGGKTGARGVTIPYDGIDPRRCSADAAAKVATALACVANKVRRCL